jgi:hypothetical protein
MSTSLSLSARIKRALVYRWKELRLFLGQLFRTLPRGGSKRFSKNYWTPRFWTGQISKRAEQKKHAELAKAATKGVVEIGVLDGETSGVLCRANPSIPVYGIDPLISDSMNEEMHGALATIKKNTEGCTNYHFLQDYSYNLAKGWDKPFDYIFIDGDHTYEAVKQDFEDWYPKLSPGGVVSFHDSTMWRGGMPYWPGPSTLCDELIDDPGLEFIESYARLSIFRKRA